MRRMSYGGMLVMAAALWIVGVKAGWAAEMEMQRPVIARVPPNYPDAARRMHVEGAVLVDVTAMPNGSVAHIHAVSGHPLLRQAAEDCVSHWRFMMMPKPERGTVMVVFALGE